MSQLLDEYRALVEYGDEGSVATFVESLLADRADLLDALRAFCGDYESTPTTDDISLRAAYRHALEVIAKAEGRQP